MGVKGLWIILSPVCEKKSLWELRDQTVAIDLSVWICENQNVDNFNSNLYLRNLFFRTSYMLLLGIKPIFVLEGKAPQIKHKTMDFRRKVQSKNTTKDGGGDSHVRSRLNSIQKQCEELLEYMGVCYVHSDGEAEALCAALNYNGVVDGVITQDSDCFLYGAKTIYRNFNISTNGGSIEAYSMTTIERKLSLGRNKLIALSLLCGCDYNDKGVIGIGKETALKYLNGVRDSQVLKEFSNWRLYPNEQQSSAVKTNDPFSKLTKKVKEKALSNCEFPFLEVQNEFLSNDVHVSQIRYSWKQPNVRQFVMLVGRKLGWNANYALEKFLPIYARWHLLHDANAANPIIQFDGIVKKRTLKGVSSYEVKWKDFDSVTVEPISLLRTRYETQIQDFERNKLAAKKTKTSSKKNNNNNRNIRTMLNDITNQMQTLEVDHGMGDLHNNLHEDSLTVSDFECSATDLLELSAIVESIVSRQ